MRNSFRTELLFSLEVCFLENDILSFYRNYYNAFNNNNNKTAHLVLQIDVQKNIDKQ